MSIQLHSAQTVGLEGDIIDVGLDLLRGFCFNPYKHKLHFPDFFVTVKI